MPAAGTSIPNPARLFAEHAVLGGGLAGSALALLLAHAGRPVTLIEQHLTPRHKVCGDFLSAEALAYLTHLGLSAPALGAVPLSTLRLATGTHLTEAALPFPAASLTRFVLDEALLRHAAGTPGVTLLRGHRVESLSSTPSGHHLTLANGSQLHAETAFLATGKHDLRGHLRPPGRHPGLLAFKQYLRLTPAQHRALGPAIELILFPHGYAGLQPVEPDLLGPRANLCLLIAQPAFRALGGTWPALLQHLLRSAPHLRSRLSDAEPLLSQPLALSRIPYGLLRSSAAAPTVWPLGDQAVVIPSLTGDGMSLALHTAHLAAATCLAGHSSAMYLATLHRTLARQLGLATRLSRLAVRPALQPALGIAASLVPPLLPSLARRTRIVPSARLAASPPLAHIPSR